MIGETQTGQPRIILERPGSTVRLMQLVPEDSEAIFELIAFDPEHLSQFGDVTAEKYPSVDAVRESIVNPPKPSKLRFGIWDDATLVGSDNITPLNGNRAELGSWIGRQFIGRGYAGMGRELLVDYAFGRLGLDEVFCNIVVGNTASQSSVVKSGFSLTDEFVDETGTQVWQYTLKIEDWRQT